LGAQGGLGALWRVTPNAKEPIIRLSQTVLGLDLLPNIAQSRTTLHFFFIFLK
jgi:hypothetical protein